MRAVLDVLIALSLVGLLNACQTTTTKKGTKEKDVILPPLSESDIFDGRVVGLYLNQNETIDSKANALFLQGLDAYKNKKRMDSAEYYFTKSILVYPTARTFFELGNVLQEKKEYQTALKAYRMADQLKYEPFASLLYNMACTYSLAKDGPMAARFVENAIEAGFIHVEEIDKDKRLAYVREEEGYLLKESIQRGLRGITDSENLAWNQFKKQFPKVSLPINLDEKSKKVTFTQDLLISYDFEKFVTEMRSNRFSREVSDGFYYYAQLAEKAEYVCLVYIRRNEFMDDASPLTYILTTFNHEGKLIDKLEIAGRTVFSDLLKSSVISNLEQITITYYQTNFKEDPDAFGYEDNPIVSKEKVKVEQYTIQQNGKIAKIQEKLMAVQ